MSVDIVLYLIRDEVRTDCLEFSSGFSYVANLFKLHQSLVTGPHKYRRYVFISRRLFDFECHRL